MSKLKRKRAQKLIIVLFSNVGLMRSLLIRDATFSDIEKLVELRLLLQQHAERSNPWVWKITEEGKTLLRQEFEEALGDSNTCIPVAEMRGKIIGFSQGEVEHRTDYLPESVGTIALIFVAESFRRQGIGSRLIEKLCQFFIKEKVEQVTLRFIIGNIEAQRFWIKLNFEPIITTVSIRPEELKKQLAK